MQQIDEQAILQWWDIFKSHNPLVEVRLIGANKTASGYFSDPHTLINAIRPYAEDFNTYFVLNAIKPECYGRDQQDKIVLKPKNTTNDKEILGRDWVLKFVLFSASAGIIQIGSFTLLNECTEWRYWPCYLISLLQCSLVFLFFDS